MTARGNMTEQGKKMLLVVVDILSTFIAALPSAILTLRFSPYQRGIYCDDESINYPYRRDTISHGAMAAVTITSSIVIITTGEAYLVHTKRLHSNSQFNQYLSALYKVVGTFLFGAAISQSLTDLAKFTIGRPRPNFLAVCAPVSCSGYVLQINCTGSLRNVTESRLSFYSGHSSFGMYCMLFLAVKYVSDFFKQRPPPCTRTDPAESEHLEQKPSPQPPDSQRSNHYNYSAPERALRHKNHTETLKRFFGPF
uniref:phospholipid phosphatase 2 isoform X4 n=1 Tax=Doryrhamphus excisus TaxID=161450 RepID=UPI0025ADD936|nr:phospholipid phosphatase 2 isoform X4 [Doryrhamphus excisus]